MIASLITERQAIAYKNLRNKKYYQELENRQTKAREAVKELCDSHFNEEQIRIINDFFAHEVEKQVLEEDQVYMQGFKDGFSILKISELPIKRRAKRKVDKAKAEAARKK